MKKKLCKIALFLCCFVFSISSIYARSQNATKRIEEQRNGRGFTSRQGTSNAKGKKQQTKASSTEQTEPRYRGDFQFALGYAAGEAKYYEEYYYSYYSREFKKKNNAVGAFTFGIENHNMFRVTPFQKVNFYLGFMESFFFSADENTGVIDFTIGGALGVKFSKVAFVQAGLGLDTGIVLSPSNFVAPAFFFELQAKFFPNAVFSPLIGMKFTKFSGEEEVYTSNGGYTTNPVSVSLNSFFIGGSWNFRKRK